MTSSLFIFNIAIMLYFKTWKHVQGKVQEQKDLESILCTGGWLNDSSRVVFASFKYIYIYLNKQTQTLPHSRQASVLFISMIQLKLD